MTNFPPESLMTDHYQLSMYRSYMLSGQGTKQACFEYFFRKFPRGWDYLLTAGLEQVIEYINSFDLDAIHGYLNLPPEFPRPSTKITMYAVPEGAKVMPNEPIIQIIGDLAYVQLLESRILNLMNYQSLVATKARRIVNAANGKPIFEFGLRRGQCDGAHLGSRAAHIGGCSGTSNVYAGLRHDIPISGTHAHSWVMSFDTELEAFMEHVKHNQDTACLLLDTYDTVNSGIPNAIKTFKAYPNVTPKVRLDSGDFVYLSKIVRRAFTQAGLGVIIIASNDLDEYAITDLEERGSQVDIYACGTNLITVKDNPALGGVYKLVAMNTGNETDGDIWVTKAKHSEELEKATKGGIGINGAMVPIYCNGVFQLDSILKVKDLEEE